MHAGFGVIVYCNGIMLIGQQRLNESVYRILTLKGEFDLNSAWVSAPDVDQLNAQLDELLAALDAAEA